MVLNWKWPRYHLKLLYSCTSCSAAASIRGRLLIILVLWKFGCGYNSRASTIRGRLVMTTLRYMGVLQKNLCTCHGSWFIILGLHGDKTWFWGLPWLNVPITTILVDLTWHTLTFGMKLGVSLELQLIYFESGVAFYLYLPWENVFP